MRNFFFLKVNSNPDKIQQSQSSLTDFIFSSQKLQAFSLTFFLKLELVVDDDDIRLWYYTHTISVWLMENLEDKIKQASKREREKSQTFSIINEKRKIY